MQLFDTCIARKCLPIQILSTPVYTSHGNIYEAFFLFMRRLSVFYKKTGTHNRSG